MTLAEAFEANREAIAAQVLQAQELMSLHTTLRITDNGAVILQQPNAAVALTPSQAKELMLRIRAAVLAS